MINKTEKVESDHQLGLKALLRFIGAISIVPKEGEVRCELKLMFSWSGEHLFDFDFGQVLNANVG